MSQNTIPVVDLEDYLSDDPTRRQTFVDAVGSSLRDIGFFALINHRIDNDLKDNAYRVSQEFFDLPDSAKAAYEKLEIKGQRGYTSFGREHAKDSNAPDLKEFWHVGQEHPQSDYPANIWPQELPEFQKVMTSVYSKLESCAFSVLEACSLFINEDKKVLREMAEDGNTILRLIHYPPIPDDAHPSSVRAAAHEDINLITLLIDATSSGLEILDRHNNWLPVVTPNNSIIIDSGDMLQNVTNGYFKATTHRVVNPEDSRQRRFSMPFFVHARSEVPLNPLPSCLALTGDQKYPDITAGQYLHQRLVEIGLA